MVRVITISYAQKAILRAEICRKVLELVLRRILTMGECTQKKNARQILPGIGYL